MTNLGYDSPTTATTTQSGSSPGGGAGDQLQQGMEQAKQVAGQAGEQLAEKAQELGGQAQQKFREQVDTRSTEVGEQVTATASAVRDASQRLREQGQDLPAQLIEQAASRAEQLGQYLRTSSADRLLHDVEDLGRRQPWVAIAGGIALGFLGARFLKASSRDRYNQRYNPSTPTGFSGSQTTQTAPWEANLSGTATPARRDTPAPAPLSEASLTADTGSI